MSILDDSEEEEEAEKTNKCVLVWEVSLTFCRCPLLAWNAQSTISHRMQGELYFGL